MTFTFVTVEVPTMKILFLFISGVMAIPRKEDSVLEDFNNGNIQFAAAVYKEMLQLYPNNFLMCPISVRVILALAHAGASGNTAKQLAEVLRFPNDKKKIKEIALKLTPHLQVNNNKYILTSANKMYLADRFKLKNQFKSTAINVFSADTENINFSNNEKAAMEMNRWVQEKTFDKIKDLIKSELLSSDTVALLINAMYFKANWVDQFDPDLTEKSSFSVSNHQTVVTDMMRMRNYYSYHNNSLLDAQFLELPYEGNDVTMVIALPNRRDGLPELEARIDEVLAHSLYPVSYDTDVDVVLPKFRIETTIAFKNILKELGIVEAFDETSADFSEMSIYQRQVFISEVTQKAFIEVTEKGTTAGAATGIYAADRSLAHGFIADHPFIFFLKHKVAGILFVGRYVTPETANVQLTTESFNVDHIYRDRFVDSNLDQGRIWIQ